MAKGWLKYSSQVLADRLPQLYEQVNRQKNPKQFVLAKEDLLTNLHKPAQTCTNLQARGFAAARLPQTKPAQTCAKRAASAWPSNIASGCDSTSMSLLKPDGSQAWVGCPTDI